MEKREKEMDGLRKMIKEVNENVLKLERRMEELTKADGTLESFKEVYPKSISYSA